VSKSRTIALAAAVAVVIGGYSWQPNFAAKWHIIDDHEILKFIDGSNRGIPSLLLSTEVGSPGRATRYRPSYYVLRLLEASVWGRNVRLWYMSRFAIFVFCAFVLLKLLIDGFGLLGVAFGAVFLMRDYWADIFARLGPGETYAAVGLAILAVCYKHIWTNDRPMAASWIGLAGGAIVAAGSKENFVLLAIPLICLAVRLWIMRRLTFAAVASLAISLAWIMFIAVTVTVGVRAAGQDVYAGSVAVSSRLGLALHLFRFRIVKVWLLCVIAIAAARMLVGDAAARNDARRFVTAEAILFAVYGSQYVFYNGNFPGGQRFDFPGMLARDLALLFCVRELVHLADAIKPHRGPRVGALAGAAALAIFLAANTAALGANRRQAARNRDLTAAFTKRVEAIADRMRSQPSIPIIVRAHRPLDYEPVLSTRQFLSSYGVTNSLFLDVSPLAAQPGQTPLDELLTRELADVSTNGRGAYLPFAALAPGAECASIGISGDSHEGCLDLGRLW